MIIEHIAEFVEEHEGTYYYWCPICKCEISMDTDGLRYLTDVPDSGLKINNVFHRGFVVNI